VFIFIVTLGCQDEMVLHIVPLPSTKLRNSDKMNSGIGYEVPPLLQRLNGTFGAATSAASVVNHGNLGKGSSSGRSGGIEIRVHGVNVGGNLLGDVMRNARLHVIVTPPELAEKGNTIEHIHEAMLAG
jgi:hypothetical protein